ncbi:MAG: hypothetical protein QXU98_03875 [Candidatus Parvarchaeota archaeon]
MPAQLILQQAKRPSIPYILASVSYKDTIFQIPTTIYGYAVVVPPVLNIQYPEAVKGILIFLSVTDFPINEGYLFGVNEGIPAMSVTNVVSPDTYNYFGSYYLTDNNGNQVNQINDYNTFPFNVTPIMNACWNIVWPYFVYNKQYYFAVWTYSPYPQTTPTGQPSPPAPFVIARLVLVMT